MEDGPSWWTSFKLDFDAMLMDVDHLQDGPRGCDKWRKVPWWCGFDIFSDNLLCFGIAAQI